MLLKNVKKSYGKNVVFEDFSYEFDDHKITVVLGGSGVGKTTLLNIIANTIDYDGYVDEKSVSYVFQEDRLIPNLTVKENIELVNNSIDVVEKLNEFELGEYENKYIQELSAGMSRRVSILRALVHTADIYLMDEPFRNLDYSLKYKLMDFVKDFHKKNNAGIIIVTHDIDVATYLADKIIVLGNGKIEKEIKTISKNTREQLLKFFISK
ncbi:MAG: ABC transporter ATP-binding protein [Clostridia bacterium]|nr:ABC transporter ATP-binding protein [Clostridia bacterium]